MLIVALTGGIATGKSVVAHFLEERGCYIHSADRVAHELMAPGTPAWERIKDHFGPEILNPDQSINRRHLGALVYTDAAQRSFLNTTLHPLVLDKKKQEIARLEEEGRHKIYVSEAALTIESGFTSFFDKVVVVFCKLEVQVARLMARDSLSRQSALQKIRAQMPAGKKKKHADYLVDTSGSMAETEEQTEEVFRHLMRDYEKKKAAGRTL